MDKDNLVLEQSFDSQSSPDEVFLQKQLLYQLDNNGSSNYNRNEVEFLTTSWSNNGKFMDLREGFIIIPMVMELTSDVDISTIDMKLKNDNLNFINSAMIDYNNENVSQSTPEIAPYLIFNKKMSSRFDDEKLQDHTGFRSDVDYDWDYDDDDGVYIPTDEFKKIKDPFYYNDTGQHKVIAPTEKSGINYVKKVSNNRFYYYYNCFIRLKDLPFADSLTLSRGSNVRILLTLNQFEMILSRTKIDANPASNPATLAQDFISSISTFNGSSCPVLLDRTVVNTILDAHNNYLSVKCKVAEINGHKHSLNQCRLYSPAYTLSTEVKQRIESSPQRHLVYNDVYVNHLRNVGLGNFNFLLTNSITRLKRLIIVPYLKSTQNGRIGWSSVHSPFTEDGLSHPAPNFIQDFNVSISGVNVYSTSRKFKWEQYLDELHCSYGAEGGLEDGQSTGMFGLDSFESNNGYLVVDLSRKVPEDEKVPVSVEISGVNVGEKELEFLCYLEIEKDIKIDATTGMKLM